MIQSVLGMMEGSSMAGYILLLVLGIVLVVKGGDWFVDAASWIAEVSGIPTFIIGATIVSVDHFARNPCVKHIGGGRAGGYGNRQRRRIRQLQHCAYHGVFACVYRADVQPQRLYGKGNHLACHNIGALGLERNGRRVYVVECGDRAYVICRIPC